MTANEIIKSLGIGDWTSEQQQDILSKIDYVVRMRTMSVLDSLMSQEQRMSFDAIEQKDFETVSQWVSREMPDAIDIYNAMVMDFVDELKAAL